MKPALTAEEWARFGFEDGDWRVRGELAHRFTLWHLGTLLGDIDRRHALAALSLDGQPFGFTREDVDEVRRAALRMEQIGYRAVFTPEDKERIVRLRSLADRIEALLPPE